MSEWKEYRLGDVSLKIGSGATPRGGKDVYLERGDISLIRSQNVYNNKFDKNGLAFITKFHADTLSNVEVQQQDVLLNITGDSVARVCQVPEDVLPARVNQHVAIIRTNSITLLSHRCKHLCYKWLLQVQLVMLLQRE
jgi:type I restriction enzyme S subunit